MNNNTYSLTIIVLDADDQEPMWEKDILLNTNEDKIRSLIEQEAINMAEELCLKSYQIDIWHDIHTAGTEYEYSYTCYLEIG